MSKYIISLGDMIPETMPNVEVTIIVGDGVLIPVKMNESIQQEAHKICLDR